MQDTPNETVSSGKELVIEEERAEMLQITVETDHQTQFPATIKDEEIQALQDTGSQLFLYFLW